VRGEDSAAAAVAVNKAARRTSNLAIIPHDGAPGEILVLEDIEKFEVGRGGAELGQLDRRGCPWAACHAGHCGDLDKGLHRGVAEEVPRKLLGVEALELLVEAEFDHVDVLVEVPLHQGIAQLVAIRKGRLCWGEGSVGSEGQPPSPFAVGV